MESIYSPQKFGASDTIKLSQLKQQFLSSVYPILLNDDQDNHENEEKVKTRISSIMGIDISNEEFMEIEKNCSVDHLLCDGEVEKQPIPVPKKIKCRYKILDSLPFIESHSHLEVLKTKNEIENFRSCEDLLIRDKQNFHIPIVENIEDDDNFGDMLPGDDFAMHVFFYKPFSYNFGSANYLEKFRFSYEHQVLGRNTLTELRDQIICVSDCGIQVEVGTPWDDVSNLKYQPNRKYPSGTFFIDGVFYNDMRSPEAIDYSKNILEWAKKYKIGNFKTADMHQTKFEDLSLRFGYPYVYIHQGDCEHIMVFADAHIISVNDCLNSRLYPRVYAINKNTSSICYLCNLNIAKWLVKDCERLPQTDGILCDTCVKSYCYIDEEKIGQFKLYPIFQKRIVNRDNDPQDQFDSGCSSTSEQ